MCLEDEQVLNGCLISSTGHPYLAMLHVHILSTVIGKLTFCSLSSPVNRSSECSGLSVARVKQQCKQRPSVHKQQTDSLFITIKFFCTSYGCILSRKISYTTILYLKTKRIRA